MFQILWSATSDSTLGPLWSHRYVLLQLVHTTRARQEKNLKVNEDLKLDSVTEDLKSKWSVTSIWQLRTLCTSTLTLYGSRLKKGWENPHTNISTELNLTFTILNEKIDADTSITQIKMNVCGSKCTLISKILSCCTLSYQNNKASKRCALIKSNWSQNWTQSVGEEQVFCRIKNNNLDNSFIDHVRISY